MAASNQTTSNVPTRPSPSSSNNNTSLDPNTDTPAHPPWRRDPNGVSHLGRDGVLRSLNADRTAVLDYRRLTPEEVKEYAAPFGQAALDALEGVDGRDVVDEKLLWAVPEDQKVLVEKAEKAAKK